MCLNCNEARFDGNSELVAELVTANGYKAAYAIKDGAEGLRGWMVTSYILLLLFETAHIFELKDKWNCVQNSGLPWILPKKTLSLDISGFTDAIGGALGVNSLACIRFLPYILSFVPLFIECAAYYKLTMIQALFWEVMRNYILFSFSSFAILFLGQLGM